jgi:hypothetical protein
VTVSAQELVELAMVRTGAVGYTDLARKLGLGVHGDQRVRRWLEGENEPDYVATMALLGVIGALNEDALKPRPKEHVRRAEGLRQQARRARRQLGREADQ